MKKIKFLLALLFLSGSAFAQNQGTFSGDFMTNVNFFVRDTAIKASGNPLYDNALSGNEAWLDLRYTIDGFSFFVRADAFDNSNLAVPTQAMSGFGIGAWNVTKDVKDLTISVGYIYDQIGSGILFRAYEDRGLLIDNAIVGAELKYKLNEHITIKGFSGQQKNIFKLYDPVIKGFNAEGDFTVGKVHLFPGVGVLNRTLDQTTMANIVSTINSDPNVSQRFVPVYNMYAATVYNRLTYKNFSWYVEGAYKTHEAIYADSANFLVDKPGNVEYTSLNYARKGFALNLTGKRTEDFVMQTVPNAAPNPGQDILNWQPVVAVLRPERLMSPYTPASQNVSEMAETANLLLSPNDLTNVSVTYTHIDKLDNTELYRELYGEVLYQGIQSTILQFGAQYMEYNLNLYQGRTYTEPILYSITPFGEVTYRINDKKSIRFEAQWMDSKQDYGSWLFGLLEFNIAPKFSISASDMYNYDLNKGNEEQITKANHYWSVYTAFTTGPNRFSLAWVRQVAGINCSGGVCRYEPAFNGVKATCTSSF